MMFTPKTVNELMADIAKITGGRFKMQLAAPALGGKGDRVRYIDYNRQQVWTGRDSGRNACAYMIAGALGWTKLTKTEIPEDIRRHMQAVYGALKPGVHKAWELQGYEWALKLARDEEGIEVPEDMTVEILMGAQWR